MLNWGKAETIQWGHGILLKGVSEQDAKNKWGRWEGGSSRSFTCSLLVHGEQWGSVVPPRAFARLPPLPQLDWLFRSGFDSGGQFPPQTLQVPQDPLHTKPCAEELCSWCKSCLCLWANLPQRVSPGPSLEILVCRKTRACGCSNLICPACKHCTAVAFYHRMIVWIGRMVWVGRDLEDHLVQPLAMGRDTFH